MRALRRNFRNRVSSVNIIFSQVAFVTASPVPTIPLTIIFKNQAFDSVRK
jgi:hypothetical protein